MRIALRGRGTRSDDSRTSHDARAQSRRSEPAHLLLRDQPRPLV